MFLQEFEFIVVYQKLLSIETLLYTLLCQTCSCQYEQYFVESCVRFSNMFWVVLWLHVVVKRRKYPPIAIESNISVYLFLGCLAALIPLNIIFPRRNCFRVVSIYYYRSRLLSSSFLFYLFSVSLYSSHFEALTNINCVTFVLLFLCNFKAISCCWSS